MSLLVISTYIRLGHFFVGIYKIANVHVEMTNDFKMYVMSKIVENRAHYSNKSSGDMTWPIVS